MSLAKHIGTFQNFLRTIPTVLWRAEAKFKGAECAADVVFVGRPLISVAAGSQMILSRGVQVNSALRSNPMGCFQPSVLRTMTPEAVLHLGKNVGMSAAVIVAGKSITIGEGTILGAGVVIADNDFHQPYGEWGWSTDYSTGARAVTIGKGVFIGARAIILKGVTIGDRAIVGAGAVVSRDVLPNTMVAGNPAGVIKTKRPQ